MERVKDQEKVSYLVLCKRSIWKFYEWAVVIAPLVLMLSHWYIFYVFSQNNHELLKYSQVNEDMYSLDIFHTILICASYDTSCKLFLQVE